MKLGVAQLSVGDDPAANIPETVALLGDLFDRGAEIVCTPEVTGFITTDAERQAALVRPEAEDATLAALQALAAERRGWIALGSLAVAGAERFANRSFLIGPDGGIVARYDKIHMFDVEVSETERYRESGRYAPGDRAVIARTPLAVFGLTICYDLRFPALYRRLAQAGAEVLLVPSAFSPGTGPAHWEVLLRARAIETGCFVVAAAQTGTHVTTPKPRATYGHTMVVAPWGEVLLDAGTEPGGHVVEIDLGQVREARRRIPSLMHDRNFTGP